MGTKKVFFLYINGHTTTSNCKLQKTKHTHSQLNQAKQENWHAYGVKVCLLQLLGTLTTDNG